VSKPGRRENKAFDQGREQMQKDRLKDAENLQDRQYELDIGHDKKARVWSITAVIISIISLLFTILTYFQIIPNINSTKSVNPTPMAIEPTIVGHSVSDE